MSLLSVLNKTLKNKETKRTKNLFPLKDSTFRNKDLIEGIKVILSKNVTMSKITKKFERVFKMVVWRRGERSRCHRLSAGRQIRKGFSQRRGVRLSSYGKEA